MTDMLMELSNISVQRAGNTLFSGLSDGIEPGSVTVLLGPNGAGKSSLLLAMAGMLDYRGRIGIHGRDLREYSRSELARNMAWSGALPSTEFGLSVAERLDLAAEGRTIDTAAGAMDIAHLLNRPLGRLSSGELQRTELAALALRDVPLWLVDEPTAHLDLKHQVAALSMLRGAAGAGRGVAVVLHDIQQARALADRVILFDGEGGVECGPACELLTRERLGEVFRTALTAQDDVWLPDYGKGAGSGDGGA